MISIGISNPIRRNTQASWSQITASFPFPRDRRRLAIYSTLLSLSLIAVPTAPGQDEATAVTDESLVGQQLADVPSVDDANRSSAHATRSDAASPAEAANKDLSTTPQPAILGGKHVIGAVATVAEMESDLDFAARVDTGATTSSIHIEAFEIANPSGEQMDNIGKPIRFKIANQQGKSEWLERKIADCSVIKTSEAEEIRYKVPMTLRWQSVEKEVLVSLNDRSHMTYPMLIGRNFLEKDFLVNVDFGEELQADSKSTSE